MKLLKHIKSELQYLQRFLHYRLYVNPNLRQRIIDQFHRLYYGYHAFGKTWEDTYWLGVGVQKCPMDLWVYQEILHRIKPDLIIETGTMFGGSAHYMASLCDLLGRGRIVTIDIEPRSGRPTHKRIEYITGSSVSEEVALKVEPYVKESECVLVVLDSDHSAAHVYKEMEIYSKYVTPGSYIIVEDSNISGHPVKLLNDGPMEAIEEFLRKSDGFEVDKNCEKFLLTFNPRGYLKRIK